MPGIMRKQVHFMGLLSDGGVHSLDKHLYKLCDMTGEYGIKDVFIHAFGDGRDTDPRVEKAIWKTWRSILPLPMER